MTKKLKIGILIDQLVPGGVQKSAIEEARNLKKAGHQVTIFVLVRFNYDYQYQDLTRNLKVVFLSDYNPWLFKKPLKIPYFAFLTTLHIINPFFVHRYTILKDLDFIISHGTTTCITAAAISRRLNVAYLAFIWDPMIYILEKVYSPTPLKLFLPLIELLVRAYESSFLISAALVATPSLVHKEFIMKEYNINPLIIHPGCFPAYSPIKKQSKLILGYTRWELAKNPELFIWLAQNLPQANFLIAGEWTNPKEEEYFRKLVVKNNLTGQISLLSPITKADLKKIASQSLVWLHPNFEAFGMAGLEMASLGLPIIIPRGSGVAEIFKEGQQGFFPKQSDRVGFLNSLKILLENPQRASDMGKQAFNIARKETWRKHSNLVLTNVLKYQNQIKLVCLANAFVSTRSIGGGDLFLIETAKRLTSGFNLTVILPKPGLYHWQKSNLGNVNIKYLVLPSNKFDNQDNPIPLFFSYLIRTVQTHFLLKKLPPFDLLHSGTDLVPDSIPAYFHHKSNPQIPWVSRFFHFIDYPLKREGKLWVNIGSYFLQQLSLKLLPAANLIMIDNFSLLDRLVKKGVQANKIKIQPGGVSLGEISQIKKSKMLGCEAILIGRLQPHKGVFDAIEVWSKVVKSLPKAKLNLVGFVSSDIEQKLKQRIELLNLKKNVHFTGYISDRKLVLSYCKSSKMLLFLDHEAGFGLVVAEAMASGVPVVAYDLGIFGNVYKRGFLTAKLGDTKAISKLVLTLLRNPKQRKSLAIAAKIEAQKFSWSTTSKKFYTNMKGLLSR
ncbi:glycosyltransferase [Candidatus Daviesbacteria bacterium]|nr:glycosyltransferase [Candidatus Daviesbacteria bacterium]